MWYESLQIMELFSVQWLQVDDVYCRLQCTVVLVGLVLKDLLGGTTF